MPPSSKPKLVVDARMCGPKGHGIALYVEEMAQGLATESHFEPHFLLATDCPPRSILRSFSHEEVSIPFLHPKELFLLPQTLERLRPWRFLSPSFSSLARYPCPYGMVLHDLNHLYFGGFAKKVYYRTFVKRAARDAERVFTVSQTMQTEIAAWLGVEPRTLGVAPNALSLPQVKIPPLAAYGLQTRRFFISLNGWKSHKNLAMLLEAYSKYREERADARPLVLPFALTDPRPGVIGVEGLSYPELMGLLKEASAVFTPSLYEGFSRTPLEALLLGTTSVASDIPVHREVAAGAKGIYFASSTAVDEWTALFVRAHAGELALPEPSDSAELRRRYSLEALLKPFRSWLSGA